MSHLFCKKFIIMTALLLPGPAFAEVNTTIANPDTVNWKTLPKHEDLQYTVMAGNPLKQGLFIVWLKLPKNFDDVVHSHTQVRYDTIISGDYYLGFGDTIDKSTVQKLAAGSFINCPPNVKHYGFTKDETIIQIAGMGPWEVLQTSGKKR